MSSKTLVGEYLRAEQLWRSESVTDGVVNIIAADRFGREKQASFDSGLRGHRGVPRLLERGFKTKGMGNTPRIEVDGDGQPSEHGSCFALCVLSEHARLS
jgi:hypothetical protein